MGQENSDSRVRLYKLSIRILERPLYSADTNFGCIGFSQRIKHTRLFMDEHVASPNIAEILF